jgi:hypothetical protein
VHVRRQQGELYSLGPPAWTFLAIEQGTHRLEVHVDIRVRGRSRVPHEADLVALPTDVVERRIGAARRQRPLQADAVAVVEAKWLTGDLDPLHGRAFVTFVGDLQPAVRGILACSQDGPKSRLLIERLTRVGRFCSDVRTDDSAGVAGVRAAFSDMLRSWAASL